MMTGRISALLTLLPILALGMTGCGGRGSTNGATGGEGEDAKVVNLYTWADYLAPETLSGFERRTGIKVRVSYFETNEALESRMLTGHSGFDVVVPTAPFFQRQIESGAYLPLDRTKLPNLAHLDPAIMSRVAENDPGNAHGVVYAWGTYGIGYNTKRVAQALPNVPLDSWALIFDPRYASQLARCGINILDAPAGVVRLVLKYLGRNPDAPSAEDLAQAEAVLLKIRPYIRNIDSSQTTDAIANGDICVALAYSGDFVQARRRAKEANNGVQIDYVIPKEGSLLWFDMLAIPRDAPHVANALKLIDYLMDPRVIADVSNFTGSANANTAAMPFMDPSAASDTIMYPTSDQLQRLFVQSQDPPAQARAITRLWQRFKTAQ